MSVFETGTTTAAEIREMSAAETRQMHSIQTGQSLLAIVDICLVSTADICPVSTADICPVSTEGTCPVSTADVLGGDETDFDPFFTPKMFKMEFIRRSPTEPGGARRSPTKWWQRR